MTIFCYTFAKSCLLLSMLIVFCLYTDPLQSAPEIKDLLNKVAVRANDKWKSVGLQLDMELPELNTIEDKHNKEANLCYAELFRLWKNNGDPSYTWATIIDALKAPLVGEAKLATELQEWLCKQWMIVQFVADKLFWLFLTKKLVRQATTFTIVKIYNNYAYAL